MLTPMGRSKFNFKKSKIILFLNKLKIFVRNHYWKNSQGWDKNKKEYFYFRKINKSKSEKIFPLDFCLKKKKLRTFIMKNIIFFEEYL